MGGEFLDGRKVSFLVVGVGAIGSAYLAFLTRAGHRAVGLVKRGRKLDRIKVEGIWGCFETPVRTVESLRELTEAPHLRVIFGSQLTEPGHVRITVCADDVIIGDPSGRIDEEILRELADLFTSAGIPTRYDRDVYCYLWDKIIYNCALNPLSALLRVHTRELMDRIIDESLGKLFTESSFPQQRHTTPPCLQICKREEQR